MRALGPINDAHNDVIFCLAKFQGKIEMKEGKDGNNRQQEKGKENEAEGREEERRCDPRRGPLVRVTAPHDRKNFPYKYTRVSLIIREASRLITVSCCL